MRIVKLLILSGLAIVFSVNAQAACDFAKVQMTPVTETKAGSFKFKNTELVLSDANDEFKVFGGPMQINAKGQEVCTIKDGGNYSEVYYSKSKNLLMFAEFSGSCGTHRVVNPKNCKAVGTEAKYCGNAVLDSGKLINNPPCESNGPDSVSCSSGKIFKISKDTCKLSLDEKASKKMTKKELGVELPSFDKAYSISGKGTKAAKIVNDK